MRSGAERKVHLSDDDFRRARSRPVADQPLSNKVIVQRDMVEGDIAGHTRESFKRFINDINDKFQLQR